MRGGERAPRPAKMNRKLSRAEQIFLLETKVRVSEFCFLFIFCRRWPYVVRGCLQKIRKSEISLLHAGVAVLAQAGADAEAAAC